MNIPQEGVVLLYFTASWCGPCRTMAPTFKALTEKYADKFTPVKIDIDNENTLQLKHNVSAVPTFIFLKDGAEIDRTRGAMPRIKFEQFIQKNIE